MPPWHTCLRAGSATTPRSPGRLRSALWTRRPLASRCWLRAGVFLWRGRPQALPLTDDDVLVLADFINRTGDPVFDSTLREALAVQLERSPFLKVMDDAQVREDSPPDGPSTRRASHERTASEVCLRGAGKGDDRRFDCQPRHVYAIILHATNCATGETLVREQVDANEKEGVLTAVGVAARGYGPGW